MMNPNMNYGQIVPIGPYSALSASDLSITSTTVGRGEGMITLEEYLPQLIDYLLLLEQLPLVQTNMNAALQTDIATTIAGVRSWFRTFQTWLDTSGVAHDEYYHTNNHGTWFVQSYAMISIFTKDIDSQTKAKAMIAKFGVDNSAVTETFYASDLKTTLSGNSPSFYTQFDSIAQQQLEVVRGLSYDYEMFNMNALTNIGYCAQKLGVTFNGGTKSFVSFKISTFNVGIYEAAQLLYTKYTTNGFVSYGTSNDYSKLARVFYRLSKFTDLSALGLFTKGDFVYTDSKQNSTIINSDAVRALNIALF